MQRGLAGFIAWALVSTCLGTAEEARAASLVQASGTGIYFNKPNATFDSYKADVIDCAFLAGHTRQATTTGSTALLDSLIGGFMNGMAEKQGLNANLENCMIVRGWRSIQIPADEYAKLKAGGQDEILRNLAEWVGSATPHGAVVREWGNEADANGSRAVSIVIGVGRPTLGDLVPQEFIKAGLEKLPHAPADTPSKLARSIGPTDLASLRPGTAAIVIQVRGGRTMSGNRITLRRVGPNADTSMWQQDHQPDQIVAYQNPVWSSHGVAFAFEVPPGAWRIESVDISTTGISLNFCLGAPTFDVQAGQIVYAGDFDLSADTLPGSKQDLVRAWLGSKAALADQMHPAGYSNGSTAGCHGTYIYALEIPGAPFVKGYGWGGVLAQAPHAVAAARP